jgi:hypothetical protein
VIVDDVDSAFAKFLLRGADPMASPESPIHQGPVHQGPVHQGPVHQGPVHQGPVDQGPVDQSWGTREACVDDPDGNKICFVQRSTA